MPKAYHLLDSDRPYTQDAWVEETDARGRVIKPARPARDEVEVSVRVDRQFRAQVRLPRASIDTVIKRQKAIAAACTRFALGDEIAPGIQVVEIEQRVTPAREATVTPAEKDQQGNVVRPESFTPAQVEKVEYSFTCRRNSLDLIKVGLTETEASAPDWKTTLAGKVGPVESFVG